MELKSVVLYSLSKLSDWRQRRLVVGYSGGLDSTVLLYLLAQLKQHDSTLNCLAVYVNHGLDDASNSWQYHCENYCKKLSIPFQSIKTLKIEVTGKGLENAAREARQNAFSRILNNDDVLLLAHHANDQIETLLFRLLRGSGLHGLSAIKKIIRIKQQLIVRPLLEISKQQLQQFAIAEKLQWIEDSSNEDNKFDRNFLRNKIIPVLSSRWPKLLTSISRSISVFSEQAELLDVLAKEDSLQLIAASGFLKLEAVAGFTHSRFSNFLSYWFRNKLGYSLSKTRIDNIYKDLQNLAKDGSFEQRCGECRLIQSGLRIYLVPENFFNQKLNTILVSEVIPMQYSAEMMIQLNPYCNLKICFKTEQSYHQFKEMHLEIKFGVVNENIKLENKMHHSNMRKLFQEKKIPAWLKSFWPTLIKTDEMVCLPGFDQLQTNHQQLQDIDINCLFDWGDFGHFKI